MNATITCPECGNQSEAEIPTDQCQYFYVCPHCRKRLKPQGQDCCVFCSYGDRPCPMKSSGKEKGCEGGSCSIHSARPHLHANALIRGFHNPLRNKVRTFFVVLLLAFVIGLFAVMVQAALKSRQQLHALEAEIRTLIELREAGAFGTGGFGGDKPIGEAGFSLDTLEKVKRIPHAFHITRIDEYVYQPQIDTSTPNAYAMLIGLHPGAALRAIGEVDYESARIVAGRNLDTEDTMRNVAVVGQLYAKQRLGIDGPDRALAGKQVILNRIPFDVIGIYATGNDFGDNHVFVPMEPFRRAFNPGKRLSKIFVTVDSVANVEQLTKEFKALPEVDAVTAADQVSTARATLGSVAATTFYGSILLFGIGGVLIVLIMVLATKERVREIGTLKALGAANLTIIMQFFAEVTAIIFSAGLLAVLIAFTAMQILEGALGIGLTFDRSLFLSLLLPCFVFAALGSLYPIVRGSRLSPIDAMRDR